MRSRLDSVRPCAISAVGKDMSGGKETSSGSTVTKPSKMEQTLFEEDDEFEEFPAEGIILTW